MSNLKPQDPPTLAKDPVNPPSHEVLSSFNPNGIVLANLIAMKIRDGGSSNFDKLMAVENVGDKGMDEEENVDMLLNLKNIRDVEMSTESSKRKRIEKGEECNSHPYIPLTGCCLGVFFFLPMTGAYVFLLMIYANSWSWYNLHFILYFLYRHTPFIVAILILELQGTPSKLRIILSFWDAFDTCMWKGIYAGFNCAFWFPYIKWACCHLYGLEMSLFSCPSAIILWCNQMRNRWIYLSTTASVLLLALVSNLSVGAYGLVRHPLKKSMMTDNMAEASSLNKNMMHSPTVECHELIYCSLNCSTMLYVTNMIYLINAVINCCQGLRKGQKERKAGLLACSVLSSEDLKTNYVSEGFYPSKAIKSTA